MEDVAKTALKDVTFETFVIKSVTKGDLRNHSSEERQYIWVVKAQVVCVGLLHILSGLVELPCLFHGIFFGCQAEYHLTVGASQGNETGLKNESLIVQQDSRVHFCNAEEEGFADDLA